MTKKKSFIERRQEQLEKEQRARAKQAMEDARIGDEEAIDEVMRPTLPRKLATEYHETTGSWMHRFSDVRKDDRGFHILHEDNPDAWRMKPGDLIQDLAVSPQPYWTVSKNEANRVSLEPFGANPFLTGVGAGGARITMEDIRVMTGEYEEDRVRAIWNALESGTVRRIDSVAYLLLGTVGVNFGPNGPQGGWYNPGDTFSNRGGREGMSAEEIVKADAQTLRELGFLISEAVIDGDVNTRDFGDFVGGSVGHFTRWEETPPFDTEIFKERAMANYERRGLLKDAYERKVLPQKLEAWDIAIELWQQAGGFTHDQIDSYDASFITEHFDIDPEMVSDVHRHLRNMLKWQTYSTLEEDPSNIDNAIMLLDYLQADIQMRAVGRCLMHIASADDESVDRCYAALLRFLERGEGDWLVNEAIILFFSYFIPNPQPLIMASKLPDGTNRKYAYWGLTALKDPYINQAIFTEDDPEALSALASALVSNKYMPGRHETDYLAQKLLGILETGTTIPRYHARDGLAKLMPMLRKQELNWREASEAVRAYDRETYKRNPSEELTDLEWLTLTREHMERTIKEINPWAFA